MTPRRIQLADEPPQTKFRGPNDELTSWSLLLEPLLKHPGKWALVRTYATYGAANGAAYRLRNNATPGVPEGQWQAMARQGELWVSYVGETPTKETKKGKK